MARDKTMAGDKRMAIESADGDASLPKKRANNNQHSSDSVHGALDVANVEDRQLHVGNLAHSVTEEDLATFFGAYEV